MCDPRILCVNHLLGEHNELHKIAGSIRLKKNLKGYFDNDLIEPEAISSRHAALAEEMLRRCYAHVSPLPKFDLSYLEEKHRKHKVNRFRALDDLTNRCPKCKYLLLKLELRNVKPYDWVEYRKKLGGIK